MAIDILSLAVGTHPLFQSLDNSADPATEARYTQKFAVNEAKLKEQLKQKTAQIDEEIRYLERAAEDIGVAVEGIRSAYDNLERIDDQLRAMRYEIVTYRDNPEWDYGKKFDAAMATIRMFAADRGMNTPAMLASDSNSIDYWYPSTNTVQGMQILPSGTIVNDTPAGGRWVIDDDSNSLSYYEDGATTPSIKDRAINGTLTMQSFDPATNRVVYTVANDPTVYEGVATKDGLEVYNSWLYGGLNHSSAASDVDRAVADIDKGRANVDYARLRFGTDLEMAASRLSSLNARLDLLNAEKEKLAAETEQATTKMATELKREMDAVNLTLSSLRNASNLLTAASALQTYNANGSYNTTTKLWG